MEFGVKLTAHAGVVIAASGGEANLTARLCWERQGPAR
ncbi:MAG: CU044_2847 family protein [Mycobacterium leprae]